jgi:hypothetical protein
MYPSEAPFGTQKMSKVITDVLSGNIYDISGVTQYLDSRKSCTVSLALISLGFQHFKVNPCKQLMLEGWLFPGTGYGYGWTLRCTYQARLTTKRLRRHSFSLRRLPDRAGPTPHSAILWGRHRPRCSATSASALLWHTRSCCDRGTTFPKCGAFGKRNPFYRQVHLGNWEPYCNTAACLNDLEPQQRVCGRSTTNSCTAWGPQCSGDDSTHTGDDSTHAGDNSTHTGDDSTHPVTARLDVARKYIS